MSLPEGASMELETKIANKTAHIAVIGLGYVGLPLATALAEAGFRVTGIDLDNVKVEAINAGESYLADVSSEQLGKLRAEERIEATLDSETLAVADVIFVCVLIPYDKMKAPDLRPVVTVAHAIRRYLRRGQLVILQSTCLPGTTEEVALPILEESGLKAGTDFYLAFSPARVDPASISSAGWNLSNTPKVVGGVTPRCAELASAVLAELAPEVTIVSSPRVAEMAKLLENIFRCVNIALVNELALLSERMGIDFWEVVDAAKTKPFGFMPFYPGAGVGGHSLPVNPYFLSWKAREYDFSTKLIELAAEVNQSMPFHVLDMVRDALSSCGKSLPGAQVLVLGVAFKRETEDARNSPAERVIELLLGHGADVRYHDPYVPGFQAGANVFLPRRVEFRSVALTAEALRAADVVLILTGHHAVDYSFVTENAQLIVDTTDVTRGLRGYAQIIRLGTPGHVI